MHSPWDMFIGHMFCGYIMLSIISLPFMLVYVMCWIAERIKERLTIYKQGGIIQEKRRK